jgi:hypothetical protein
MNLRDNDYCNQASFAIVHGEPQEHLAISLAGELALYDIVKFEIVAVLIKGLTTSIRRIIPSPCRKILVVEESHLLSVWDISCRERVFVHEVAYPVTQFITTELLLFKSFHDLDAYRQRND